MCHLRPDNRQREMVSRSKCEVHIKCQVKPNSLSAASDAILKTRLSHYVSSLLFQLDVLSEAE